MKDDKVYLKFVIFRSEKAKRQKDEKDEIKSLLIFVFSGKKTKSRNGINQPP